MKLIEVEKCGMIYLDHTYNLTIHEAETHLIIGANGQGKSTLIKLIMGFMKPDFGQVKKENIPIGYAPELFELPKFIKTKNYLESVAHIKKDEHYHKLIEYFEVPTQKGIHVLSKGNLQKVNLITAFMGKPKVIILDEPLSGLDVGMQKKVIEIIKDFQKKHVTFIISSHQTELFKTVATHTYHL